MNEDLCSGDIIWMKSTWEIDNISVALIGQDDDGKYDAIADVSDIFVSLLKYH